MSPNLTNLRKELRNQRRNLTNNWQQSAATTIATKISALEIFQHSQKIAFYLATEGEINLERLIKISWLQKKSCFLPLLSEKNNLIFAKYTATTELHKNKYNILEPVITNAAITIPQELDLIIVPLVGFNREGYRFGRGAGFYDRTFAYKINNPQAKPFLLGVAYAFQQVEFLHNSWDVRMEQIVTEK